MSSYANAYANRYANAHLSAFYQIYKTLDFPTFLWLLFLHFPMVSGVFVSSSPVSRTKAPKTLRFRGFLHVLRTWFSPQKFTWFCDRFEEENQVSRIKLKKVDQISRKTVSDARDGFLRHCQLKNLAPHTYTYYKENLQFFFDSAPQVKSWLLDRQPDTM